MHVSPFRRLLHWGPISVLAIIKLITWAMVHLMSMWWPPHVSLGAALHSLMFLSLAALTLYYFLQALLEGPGYVPMGWKPENEEDVEYLQYCVVCEGYKAPRSHHCKKCGRCIKKMDHHCPWINCCVGYANHGYFITFLMFAVLGCLHASIVLIICLYHAINRGWYMYHGTGQEPLIFLTLTTLLLTLLAIGLAVGVVLAVGALLYLQIRGLLRNRTTIEDWIVEKAASRREERGLPPFVYPYMYHWADSLRSAFAPGLGDGLHWHVIEGTGPYDLTMEQKAQKIDKQLRSRLFTATSTYSGHWVPILSRPRAAIAAPCTDEARLPLKPGDLIRATRQRRHWLFGEKLVGFEESSRGPRGWFPRDAVVPTDQIKSKPD
ncbi:palmitoyltransferase ZDHHC6-like [Colias croceus]|uniref:palmitoyltransferase ZDHHC6-like n=1 Tax=Colias crocea TaxID=72248 RepID=UPI001E27F88E|nr:palmitoyltransferase ZDHHC6-like [Colias croceus]